MDTVTTAIIAALSGGAAAGAGKIAENVIVEGYKGLKAVLKRKFGESSDVMKAIQSLEAKPESAGRQATLQEEVESTKAYQDPEVWQTAQSLLDSVKGQPDSEQHIQTAIGGYIAQADRGGTASVKINRAKDS